MSKRKREQLDVGRQNDPKKLKSSGAVDGIPTPHGHRVRTMGREVDDENTLASIVEKEGESKSIRKSKKAKSTNVQTDSEGQKAGIRTASTNDAPRKDVSKSQEKRELRKARYEKRMLKRMKKSKRPSKNTGEVPNSRESSRVKNGERSQTKKPSWKVSDAIGGKMLDFDPIFALNEE